MSANPIGTSLFNKACQLDDRLHALESQIIEHQAFGVIYDEKAELRQLSETLKTAIPLYQKITSTLHLKDLSKDHLKTLQQLISQIGEKISRLREFHLKLTNLVQVIEFDDSLRKIYEKQSQFFSENHLENDSIPKIEKLERHLENDIKTSFSKAHNEGQAAQVRAFQHELEERFIQQFQVQIEIATHDFHKLLRVFRQLHVFISKRKFLFEKNHQTLKQIRDQVHFQLQAKIKQQEKEEHAELAKNQYKKDLLKALEDFNAADLKTLLIQMDPERRRKLYAKLQEILFQAKKRPIPPAAFGRLNTGIMILTDFASPEQCKQAIECTFPEDPDKVEIFSENMKKRLFAIFTEPKSDRNREKGFSIDFISMLPLEIVAKIFEYFTFSRYGSKNIQTFRLVSHEWRCLIDVLIFKQCWDQLSLVESSILVELSKKVEKAIEEKDSIPAEHPSKYRPLSYFRRLQVLTQFLYQEYSHLSKTSQKHFPKFKKNCSIIGIRPLSYMRTKKRIDSFLLQELWPKIRRHYSSSNEMPTIGATTKEISEWLNDPAQIAQTSLINQLNFSRSSFLEMNSLKLNTTHVEKIFFEMRYCSHLTELDLAANYLGAVPDKIWELSSLTKLNLSKNNLKKLSKKISNFVLLKELDFSYNSITKLPVSIRDLNQLEALELRGNKISSFPPNELILTQLKNLDLSFNILSILHATISSFKSLTSLSLTGNQLQTIPNEIGRLENLTGLCLWMNRLERVPAAIGELSKLSYLNLNSNELIELPAEIGRLSNLYWFDVRHNKLSEIPPEIRELFYQNDLNYYHISDNPLRNPIDIFINFSLWIKKNT